MKLNKLLAQIISAPNFDHFSAVELRAAYITIHSDKALDPSDARRFVYAELVKLVKNGWLRKNVSKKREITTYIKTSSFNVNKIIENDEKESNINFKVNPSSNTIQDSLRQRLTQYKNELLISYGESSEYKQLCNDFPDLYELLQPQYNNAREQNARLLGQIKAVENLINDGSSKTV
tara:strand:+ start:24124 stop:24654 length:531 start_codon:yes stop_codon:yes gene_type:complete